MLTPVYMWIALMVMQVGLYFYYSASLQRATDSAVRQILVGNVANASLTQTQFLDQILCPQLSHFNCANVVVNLIDAPSNFYSLTNQVSGSSTPPSGVTSPPMNNAQTSFCIGGNGSVMVAQVYYAMPVIGIPAFAASTIFNGQPVVWIGASAVFKNEPFTTSYTGC